MNSLTHSTFLKHDPHAWDDDDLPFSIEDIPRSAPVTRKEYRMESELKAEGFLLIKTHSISEVFIKTWVDKIRNESKQPVTYVISKDKIGIFAQGNVSKVVQAMFKFKREIDLELQKMCGKQEFVYIESV